MTNLEMLKEGLKEIASNHGFKASVNEEDGLCIYGGSNVPTYCDVQMLCEDVGLGSDVLYESECGIDVDITEEWWDTMANAEYRKGLEFWRRRV